MFESVFSAGFSEPEPQSQFARVLQADEQHDRSRNLLKQLVSTNQPFPGRAEAVATLKDAEAAR